MLYINIELPDTTKYFMNINIEDTSKRRLEYSYITPATQPTDETFAVALCVCFVRV